ncbi:consortin-like [Protopterus annectens]|uniref:consortin-like n=1 Tax=Protopterus annectens TaxID=7888 RepID=UPI001CFC18A9|nr:consortin-like [Protopterus annectens]XP_043913162.1 consortin-like [Protopterus annectens]
MDEKERHENGVEPCDGGHSSKTVESGSSLDIPEVSDENENQICNVKVEAVAGGRNMSGPSEEVEDSVNNNRTSQCSNGGTVIFSSGKNYKEAVSDETTRTADTNSNVMEEPVSLNTNETPSESRQDCRHTSGSTALLLPGNVSEKRMVQEDRSLGVHGNCLQPDGRKYLQTLQSLMQQLSQKTDTSILPHCLHQIAEAYFQEQKYEKSLQVIQLAKLYHEQQLVKLCALQKQWEAKWNSSEPCETTFWYSVNDLSNDELANRVKHFVSQRTAATANKFESAETSLRSRGESLLNTAGDHTESSTGALSAATVYISGSELDLGTNPREKRVHSQQVMSQDLLCDAEIACREPAGNAFSVENECKEGPCSDESSAEAHTQSAEAVGQHYIDCSPLEDDVKGKSCARALILDVCQGMLTADAAEISEERKEFSDQAQLAAATLVTEGAEYAVQFPSANSVPQASLRDSYERLSESPHPAAESNNVVSSQDTNYSAHQLSGKNGFLPVECEKKLQEVTENTELTYISEGQICTEFSGNFEESLEFIHSHESFLEISTEAFLYNIDDAVAFGDSTVSLDDLAKRIEIEESTPAEGLTSILKKRQADEGELISQFQQKQRKRRVRFVEPEDTFDQDEVGNDSCLLLILLCIATVFLSIGGTALYCSFVDVESSMCTDFSNNMEFYFRQLQIGIEELRHWASRS